MKDLPEAEKKWQEWDEKRFGKTELYPETASENSREAFKAALRREIEKRIESRHLQKVLLILIETVEP